MDIDLQNVSMTTKLNSNSNLKNYTLFISIVENFLSVLFYCYCRVVRVSDEVGKF